MITKAAIRAEAARLMDFFRAAGAVPTEADILQPAQTLLDLYGEDIRARAYVTQDPLKGEMMLRPDFTVPVVLAHLESGCDGARYTYAGEVFRQQEEGAGRASEYIQVGYELFSADDPAAADAEVFALFQQVLLPLGLRAATGDIGILMAAVQGLATSAPRKAALLRHIWRPHRFRALIERYSGRAPVPSARACLLEEMAAGRKADDLIAAAGTLIGQRGADEIRERIAALVADAAEPPLSEGESALLDEILELRETLPMVLERLRDLEVDMPALGPAVARFAARIEALDAAGVDVDELAFEGSYGRSTMEYYDGFIFGFYAPAVPDRAPVASGGRYDALTRALGKGREHPAVGGVIRPELMLEIRKEGA